MKVRSTGKQPYFATKNSAKLSAVKKNKFSQKPSTIRGSVIAMAYLERKRQLVVSTSDCFISFWNSGLQHLVDFVQVDLPQVRCLSPFPHLQDDHISSILSLCICCLLATSHCLLCIAHVSCGGWQRTHCIVIINAPATTLIYIVRYLCVGQVGMTYCSGADVLLSWPGV